MVALLWHPSHNPSMFITLWDVQEPTYHLQIVWQWSSLCCGLSPLWYIIMVGRVNEEMSFSLSNTKIVWKNGSLSR